MKNKKLLSLFLVFAFTFTVFGNFSYADNNIVNNTSGESENAEMAKFSVNVKNFNNEINVKINDVNYTVGEKVDLKPGEEVIIDFENIPEGYILQKYNQTGLEFTTTDGYQLDGNTGFGKERFKCVISKDVKEASLDLALVGQNYKAFIDTPKEGSKELKVFGKPNTNYIVNKNLTKVGEGKLDENGTAVVKLDEEVKKLNIFTVITGDESGFGIGADIANNLTDTVDIKLKEVNIGDTEIKGEIISEDNVFASFIDGFVKGYIYNSENNVFIELKTQVFENKEFTLEYEQGLKEGDILYISGGKPLNVVNKTVKVGDAITNNGDVIRVFGDNRFETSLEIAKESYENPKNIVIANGIVSADALSVGPLANELDAPILLVENNKISKDILNYIESSKAENIYIVGGKSSVSTKVENEIENINNLKVSRIYGDDRFETSLEISKELINNYNYNKSVVIANGLNNKEADALVSAAYATESKQPIILVTNKAITNEVKDGLEELKVKSAVIAGGISTVPNNITKGTDIDVLERISGQNRYETSLRMAEKLKNVETVIIANGGKSADALASAPLSKTKNGAILLTNGEKLESSQVKYINSINNKKKIENAYIAGGAGSVNLDLENELQELVK